VADLLAAADAYVMTSTWEGFPNALLEAMCAGRPVVSTAASGAAELVRDGENGFIVPVGDEAAMCERLIALLADEPLRSRMGAAARCDVQDRFTVEAAIRRHEAVYERVTAASRRASPATARASSARRAPDHGADRAPVGEHISGRIGNS
jgi:glycosyltransferase involved in cell wall biosynthesis